MGWDQCENILKVGIWKKAKMTTTGIRTVSFKNNQVSKTSTEEEEEWEVKAIHGKRYIHCSTEYLIEWVGWTQCTWVRASDLHCAELINDWERQSSGLIQV